jgi:porin
LRTEHRFRPLASEHQITVFGRAGVGASKFNFFDEFYSVGLQVSGELWGFGDEKFGLAIAHARTSDVRSEEYGNDETALELTSATTFNTGLAVQPSLQWIGSPGAARDAHDAVVLGLRFSWSFD